MLSPVSWIISPPRMRSVVLVGGILRGMGRESQCEVLALRHIREDLPPVYSHCAVISAAADLPDGEYTVFFEGTTVTTRREGGLWLADTSPIEDPDEDSLS